ncbi:MAG: AMP-binding protein, partial [Candidatus Bathyarchaeia archaeon]
MEVPESYPRGVPISIKYPEIPVYAFLENTARKFPNRDALIYLGSKIKYRELWEQATRLANALGDLNIRKDDRVALLLPNTPHFIIAYNGIMHMGGIVVTLNPLMPRQEICRELELTDAKALIVLDKLLDKLPEERPENLIVAEASDYAPLHLRLLDRIAHSDKETPGRSHKFKSLASGKAMKEAAMINPREDVAAILFTAGTTGIPKGVMLTHYNLVSNALQSYHWLRGWGYSPKPQPRGWPVVLCALPFFHSYGMVVMNEAVQFGCTLVLLPRPNS